MSLLCWQKQPSQRSFGQWSKTDGFDKPGCYTSKVVQDFQNALKILMWTINKTLVGARTKGVRGYEAAISELEMEQRMQSLP